MVHAARPGGSGTFSWAHEQRRKIVEALNAMNGKPGWDDVQSGRARRIIEKTENETPLVDFGGRNIGIEPLWLTLPEMITTGFALSRYCGGTVAAKEGTGCRDMLDDIRGVGNTLETN